MRIHLVNPSDVSFGTAVITPRWQYVLAAATPARHATPLLVDETLEPIDESSVQPGDVVGISIHTGNTLRGYFPGTLDFAKWEREATDIPRIDDVPLTRYWLIPPERCPRVYLPHPIMNADQLRSRTQDVWNRFYAFNLVWQRSRFLKSVRARLAFVLISR